MISSSIATILGGIICVLVSAFLGNFFGGRNRVSEQSCTERRQAHNNLIEEKINHVVTVVNRLEKKFDHITRD